MEDKDLLNSVVSLCKRRGFIFQSSEIYGGLKSAYDFGPLGTELKRNIAANWWQKMVHEREDVVGLDASIVMHPKVWEASGHLAGFSDPLVDCLNCKERFRADKAQVGECGYICPKCGGSNLSDERQFNLMFRTSLGPVDPIESVVNSRPETAQAMFVQFLNISQSMSMKVPFGIAQQGKSFRNEVTTEKFIFRTCEFEQMEMEFFVEPGTQKEWLKYWTDFRLNWWKDLANNPDNFQTRAHTEDELAHYADACFDIDYKYPWGWDELEGVASRTDYDLGKHQKHSGTKLSYFDQNKEDPETGKKGWRYLPYVIEPAAGLTRAVLAYLLDAYSEEEGIDSKGNTKVRKVLKLNPKLSPIKVAVLPLTKKDNLPDSARDIVKSFMQEGINASYDEKNSIGKRYSKHDEAGTPYCLTVDHESLEDNCVTIRDRDTTKQQRIPIEKALEVVKNRIANS
ncbi:UNVERIFIED_CONTAM: hypothetical protein GTU68_008758 [Idotea baltica]|nr:hypothetical protein [Idotea baltica]